MGAETLNLEIEKGATFQKTIIWKDSTGTVIDLTGYTARMDVREDFYSVNPAIALTTENGGIVITALEGKIALNITAAATAALTIKKGVYDLELVNGAVVTRLLEGRIRVKPEVTR